MQMPAKLSAIAGTAAGKLALLGQQIRAYRKALRIDMASAAEAAGMSRMTWHRIEQGEPSVTMGAYLNALDALGLDFGVTGSAGAASGSAGEGRKGWIPARIGIADYPQLKQLAWQVHGTGELTPREALGIYERNARHLDLKAMEPAERDLLEALRTALGPIGDV
jgi:transcriptional regulator with XRE-family HTH domain